MAEGFISHLAGDEFEAHSAGVSPTDEVHPHALEAMSEIGIDISGQHPKGLGTYLGKRGFNYLVIVCERAEKECPKSRAFGGARRGNWHNGPGRRTLAARQEGRPVRPGITWLDARVAHLVEEWMASGVFEDHFHKNGNIIFPGCQAPLLAFFAQTEPETLSRASTAAYCKDMVLQRLTGERATDVSDASLPFLDPRSRHRLADTVIAFRSRQTDSSRPRSAFQRPDPAPRTAGA